MNEESTTATMSKIDPPMTAGIILTYAALAWLCYFVFVGIAVFYAVRWAISASTEDGRALHWKRKARGWGLSVLLGLPLFVLFVYLTRLAGCG